MRYRSLVSDLRSRYGKRVQKIPLDAGSTCPNRDGTLSKSGCIFCNPLGSGTGLHARDMSLARQWEFWTQRLGRKYKTDLFWGYLQSFSNTHGPMSRLRMLLDELQSLPGLRLLSLGTRPDCLDPDKAALLADAGFAEVWLDMGLQSSNDATLRRINRGHDWACFAQGAELAHAHGLRICAHVIHGLPGEGDQEFLETVRAVSSLPVCGVKFHNLFVARGSTLEKWWRQGDYACADQEGYVNAVASALELLRPDIIVHRLNADPMPGELLAPAWAGHKQDLLRAIQHRLDTANIRQGSAFGPGSSSSWG